MPVYVVLADKGREAIAARIKEHIPPERVFSLTQNSWLIAYDGPTQSCAELLDVRGDKATAEDHTGIVFAVSNYSGRFNTNVWEWLKLYPVSKIDP